MSEKEKLNIRVEMQGEMLDRFKKVQSQLGIESGTDVFRFLVSDKYHNLFGGKKDRNAQTPTPTKNVSIFDLFSMSAGTGKKALV